MANKDLPIAVIDFETDPFLYGRTPKPFAVCFKSADSCWWYWGDDCVQALLHYLETKAPHRIYAHNGGKFDFFFLLDALENPIKVIRSRIAKARLGKHELRDSYCILPMPLSAYKKDEIQYWKFEREHRDRYKEEITKYLLGDCLYLFDLVCAFIDRFGVQLTVGGTALRKLREYHPFPNRPKAHDDKIRPYYSGGRVEVFQQGIHHGRFRVYDVNSMYPHVMRDFAHPVGSEYSTYTNYEMWKRFGYRRCPYFIHFSGTSRGALPLRDTKGRLQFPHTHSEWLCTNHEFETAWELGLITIDRFHSAICCEDSIRFSNYVDVYSAEKINAKKSGDKVGEIFAKLLLNSAYGKTGQNPEHYKDYWIRRAGEDAPEGEDWELSADFGDGEIWETPSKRQAYYDVAIAASITGAARSVLMRAIAKAKNPLYCDTDSLICEELDAELHETKLGAWKLEAECDCARIMSKKLYILTNEGTVVKAASKGFAVKDFQNLIDLSEGKEYNHFNDAPNFKLSGSAQFVKRRITVPDTQPIGA